MLIKLNGIQREVNLVFVNNCETEEQYEVGKAKVYFRKKGNHFVNIKGIKFNAYKRFVPFIIDFVLEYKRLAILGNKTNPYSFVGEGNRNTEYVYKPQSVKENYLSGVPKWITELKIWKWCCGEHRKYWRRIDVPQEFKPIVLQYKDHCCKCAYRQCCNGPCLCPEINCSQELFKIVS